MKSDIAAFSLFGQIQVRDFWGFLQKGKWRTRSSSGGLSWVEEIRPKLFLSKPPVLCNTQGYMPPPPSAQHTTHCKTADGWNMRHPLCTPQLAPLFSMHHQHLWQHHCDGFCGNYQEIGENISGKLGANDTTTCQTLPSYDKSSPTRLSTGLSRIISAKK